MASPYLGRADADALFRFKPVWKWYKHAGETSGEDEIGTLDDGALTLREACNKFIHAQEVRAIYEKVTREEDEQELRRWYLTGEIELTGTLGKKSWNAVLYVPPFLETVLDRIGFGWPE